MLRPQAAHKAGVPPRPQDTDSPPALFSSLEQREHPRLPVDSSKGSGPSGPQVKAREEAQAAAKASPSSSGIWNENKRFGFSGRPSCPSRTPKADDSRRRAAVSTGKALGDNQLLQQQRWLLLQQQLKGEEENAVTQASQQVQQKGDESPQSPAVGTEGNKRGGGTYQADASGNFDQVGRSVKHEPDSSTSTWVRSQYPETSSPVPHQVGAEYGTESHSCPRAPLRQPPLALRVEFTCPRQPPAPSSVSSQQAKDPSGAAKTQEKRPHAGAGPQQVGVAMRAVFGGLEASVEEPESAFTLRGLGAPIPKLGRYAGFTFRPTVSGSISAAAGTGGAAVGEGETPAMTWVLGAAHGDGFGAPAELLVERESLLEALGYSFALHADEVASEAHLLGLAPGHAPAGSPQFATLQFSFDSVPLHEQRVIRTELGRRVERLNETSAGSFFLTPAVAQLRGKGSGEVLSLTEDGRVVSGGLFEQWVKGLEGPEGAAALHLYSLSLEDLRVILALQEETGGPVSLVTAEDWGDDAELSRFLKPLGGGGPFFPWEIDPVSQGGEEEEGGEGTSDSDASVDESYWHWLTADPALW